MTCGIYSIETRKGQIYIGSSKKVEWRWICHESALRCNNHNNQKLQNSYNKNGKKIKKRVLIICLEKDLLLYEQIAFAALKPKLNLSLIAGRVEFTPEILAKAQAWKKDPIKGPAAFAKISKSNSGKVLSENHRKNIGLGQRGRAAWNKGIPFTKEHKAKLPSKKGIKLSDETKARMKIAQINRYQKERENESNVN